jgi:hypothetical protein
MTTYRLTLSLTTALPAADVEVWAAELVEDGREHLLDGERLERGGVEGEGR